MRGHCIIGVAAAVLLTGLPGTQADDSLCNVDFLRVDGAGLAYVAVDRDWEDWFYPWIYLESNGREGLQRGGEGMLGGQDACENWDPDPDTLVW